MERSRLEELVIDRSSYMARLQDEYGRPNEFEYHLSVIEGLLGSDEQLRLFKDHRARGKIIFYVGRRLVHMHEEFINTMLTYLGDESMNAARWEKFFSNYREDFIKMYRNFLKDDGQRVVLFEVVNRRIMRDTLTGKIRASEQLSAEIMDKVSRIINSLFYYARKVIASSMYIEDALIVEAYEKAPVMVPKLDEREILKYLATAIQSRKVPYCFFTLLSGYLKGGVVDESEKKLVELMSRRNVFSREELKGAITAYPLAVSDQTVDHILAVLKEKLTLQLGQLTTEKSDKSQKLIELRNKMREYVNTFAQKVYESAQRFSTQEILRVAVNEMTTPFIKMGYYIRDLDMQYQDMARKEEGVKQLLQIEKPDVLSWTRGLGYRHMIELAFLAEHRISYDDTALQRELKEAARGAKANKTESELVGQYRKGGLFAERFDVPRLLEQFQQALAEVIRPLVIAYLLEELVEYFPPLGTISQENVKFLAEQMADDDVYCVIDDERKAKASSRTGPSGDDYREIDAFCGVVSVMVYDIRGSTFMGTKLSNARMENEIRNLFNEAMLEPVVKYGGIPIKDIGDGGIIFFCANGRDIVSQLGGGGGLGTMTAPKAGPEVGLTAARCAMEMVQKAQEFVQANLLKYPEWFKDVEERSIRFEGVTLATMPPEYKKIFQVGIGIASGLCPREVFLDRNAYGDLDISGMLVREANIFSKAKDPEGSIILCDDATIYNIILNVPKFSFLSEGGLKVDPIVSDVIQALEYWLKVREQRRGFLVEMFRMSAKRIEGKISYDRGGKMFAMVGDFGMMVKDEGVFMDGKGGRSKYLFELGRG